MNISAHRSATLNSRILAALILFVPLFAATQDLSRLSVPTDGDVSVEQIQLAISTIETREGLDDETREMVLQHLRDAESQVQNKISAEAMAAGFTAALDSAPADTEKLQATLNAEAAPPPSAESLGIRVDSTLTELEQAQAREVANLAALDARVSELEARIEAQESRPAEARERIDELRRSVEEIIELSAAPPPSGEQQILTEARGLATDLKRAAQNAEINSLEQEVLTHSVRLDLLRAQSSVATRSRVGAASRVDLLRTLVNEKRQLSADLAQQQAAAVELAAAGKHPVVQTLAENNTTITQQLPAVAASIGRTGAALDEVMNEANEIAQGLARSRQRLEVGGLSRVIGRLLLDERRNLPHVSQHRAAVRANSKTLAEIGLAQVQIQEQRRKLTSSDARVEEVMVQVAENVVTEDELASIRSEVVTLLQHQSELLNQADHAYRNYLQVLGDLDVAQRRLLDSVAEYEEFLDQHLIWIPNAPIVGTGDWQAVPPAAAWALSAKSWLSTTGALLASLQEHLAVAIFSLLLFAALVATRRPLAARYKAMSGNVGGLSTDTIGLTLESLAIAAVRALPVPLLLYLIGWSLQQGPQQSDFSNAVSQGILAVAPFLYNLMLFRILCARDGVMRVHFGWQESNLAIIRRQFGRLMALGVPLLFVTVMFYSSDVMTYRVTLGRFAFVALLVIFSLIIHPLAHPDSGVVSSYYARKPDSRFSSLRWFWYVLAVGGPLLIGLAALLGYVYASAILTGALVDTIWLALAIMIVNMSVLRWLALARRRLAWQTALKEREASETETDKESGQETEGELSPAEPKPLDIDAVDQQTRKLIRASLTFVALLAGWGIWSDVLPAFNLLEQVALWSKTIMVDGVETIAPVTLADVLLALVVATVTVIGSRNLPGLMEIAVLQRLTLQPGSHYTINTLLRYTVVSVGIFSVLNIVGWNWSQIQWLVAALSVGLGFGLQEIVANFFSGLIILFERPVRVGDTVTVGQLSGKVSQVRIRATTITDWDEKEIIVPNKSIITEQVINWTLSNPVTRIVIPVGISYGSDVELATKVMDDTLRSLRLVLDKPEPNVYFIGFGDSSLDFELCIYARQIADRRPLMHIVHDAILKALREHGIEIPFPQRDLHILKP